MERVELAAPEPMIRTEMESQLEDRAELPGNDGERYELADDRPSEISRPWARPRLPFSHDAFQIPERLTDKDNMSSHIWGEEKRKGDRLQADDWLSSSEQSNGSGGRRSYS